MKKVLRRDVEIAVAGIVVVAVDGIAGDVVVVGEVVDEGREDYVG